MSEKILFGEVSAGQIIRVEVVGEGETAEFTFEGVDNDDIVEEPVTMGASTASVTYALAT